MLSPVKSFPGRDRATELRHRRRGPCLDGYRVLFIGSPAERDGLVAALLMPIAMAEHADEALYIGGELLAPSRLQGAVTTRLPADHITPQAGVTLSVTPGVASGPPVTDGEP